MLQDDVITSYSIHYTKLYDIIGVRNLILPFHIVAIKLKTCIPDAGTAAKVPIINTVFSVKDIPVAYM